MATVKQSEFAKIHNVSRKTVTVWKKDGWLAMDGNLVDVEKSNALLEQNRRASAKPAAKSKPVTDSGNKSDSDAGNAETSDPDDGEQDGAGSLNDARRTKEFYAAQLNKLEFEQKAGSLIELEVATQVLFDEFRAQRDSWMNWPIRVGPLIAADLGMDAEKVIEVLTAHVHKHITDLGDVKGDFAKG